MKNTKAVLNRHEIFRISDTFNCSPLEKNFGDSPVCQQKFFRRATSTVKYKCIYTVQQCIAAEAKTMAVRAVNVRTFKHFNEGLHGQALLSSW